MHLNNHHKNIERNIQLMEIKKFNKQITTEDSLITKTKTTPLKDSPQKPGLSSSKSSPNMVAVNILKRYNIRDKFLKEIKNARNREKLNSCLYSITKGNKKLMNELIKKKLLAKEFVERKKLETILIKQELLKKGLIKEKDLTMKEASSRPKKKKIKGEYLKIIYTPMGNKR